jgi:hypothetical protein
MPGLKTHVTQYPELLSGGSTPEVKQVEEKLLKRARAIVFEGETLGYTVYADSRHGTF